jgi:hypothetical protein
MDSLKPISAIYYDGEKSGIISNVLVETEKRRVLSQNIQILN